MILASVVDSGLEVSVKRLAFSVGLRFGSFLGRYDNFAGFFPSRITYVKRNENFSTRKNNMTELFSPTGLNSVSFKTTLLSLHISHMLMECGGLIVSKRI